MSKRSPRIGSMRSNLPATPPGSSSPVPAGKGKRGLLVALLFAALISVLLSATFAFVAGSVNVMDSDLHAEPAEVARFAGFSSTIGLEVTDARLDSWLDSVAEFALRGSPADIDRALDVASFTGPFSPGVHVQEPSTVGATPMVDVRSAQDTWIDGAGQQVHRRVVRGALASEPGREVLHVMAFTT